MRVSVVIPAFNEAATIGDVVRASLRSSPLVEEVLVVDDGSSDATSAAARAAGARVLTLPVNQGKGAALQRALPELRGDVVVFIDGDGQDDPRELPRLLDAMAGGADLVLGSRFLGRFGPGAITPLNRGGNRLLTEVINVLFRARITDAMAGFRAIRRDLLEEIGLAARGYDVESDMLGRVLRRGGRVVEVPVSRAARQSGQSGLRSVRDGLRILARIVRVRLGG